MSRVTKYYSDRFYSMLQSKSRDILNSMEKLKLGKKQDESVDI